ncbi:glycosyltransferase [Hymenobacter guriensis]|uniref:Glycosyltransferase n=1 Tax=Hymenobacter guriensis TaxID=2793065 RepID=A0ABS0L5E1_9BACT|nr:glycosyltransferase [Hymenobacter guriensis]MBG8555312.1 glycosyltransferase [Hymenobacter guriensis]
MKVLLLGWDEPQNAETPALTSLALTQALAPDTATVLLPTLPADAADFPASAEVTGLGNLSMSELQAAVDAARASAPQRGAWQAPVSPYIGASEAAAPAAAGTVSAAPTAQPALLVADAFEAEGGEPATDEAADLSQPENNLSMQVEVEATPETEAAPETAAAGSWLPGAAERATPDEALAVLRNPSDVPGDLNFRVIQYARFATPLALSKPFEVIYAGDWPTWLAALEIRQRTGCPLVLRVDSLAQDRPTADDRGWAQALERLALRRADVILTSSEDLCHRVRQLYGIPLRRMRVQPAHTDAAEVARTVRDTLTELAASA